MFCRLRRTAAWGSVCLAMASPWVAQAEDAPAAAAAPAVPAAAPASEAPVAAPPVPLAPAAPAPGKMDFDLFKDDPAPAAAPAMDPKLGLEIERRRSMLETHQILGLTTLGVMAATCVLGQLDYNDMYGSGHAGSGNYLWPKRVGAYATTGLFISTAVFSVFAPVPFEKHSEGLDRITIHKIAVIGASLGMAAQMGLGIVAARSADAGHQRESMAQAHMIVGWSTLALMTTAAATWVF